MLCVCCLQACKNKKEFFSFTVADRKLHRELTKLEIKQSKPKICKTCRGKLKSSAEFHRLCIESYEQLIAVAEKKPQTRTSARREEREIEDIALDDCPVAADESDDNDEVPISTLKLQLQEESKEQIANTLPATIEEIPMNKEVGNHLCPECGEAFTSTQNLQAHAATHSVIKSWKCADCDKVFATKFRLKAHTRIHTGERPFVCEICSLSFAQGNALTCHRRVHTKERPFVCKICSKSFSQNTTLKTHMAALHLGKSVECDEPGCDKKFTRRSYLLIHKRDHAGERKYACDRCPNQYKQKSHLDRHIEASHLGIRHRCDYPGCSSEFSKAWSLKMHKFVHSEVEQLPYKCNLCPSAFQRRDKLLKHRLKSHPEAGELKCEPVEIHEPKVCDVEKTSNAEDSNYVMITSTVENYTIQNLDGTFTEVLLVQN